MESYPEFELRRYEPFLVAETEVDGDFDGVGNQAFRILAAYIFGRKQALPVPAADGCECADVVVSPSMVLNPGIQSSSPVSRVGAHRQFGGTL